MRLLTLSSRVQRVRGGLLTRLRVKSPRRQSLENYDKETTRSGVTLNPTDHVVILSMGTLTKWIGVRKLVDKTTLYSPYNPKCVIFHNRRATDVTEESLLHSTLEADDSDFR